MNETGTEGTCEQMLLCMSRALDGDLPANEMAELSAHLAGCASCRAHSLEMNTADDLFREMGNQCSVLPVEEASVVQLVMQRVRLEAAPVGGIQEFSQLVAQNKQLQDQLRSAGSLEGFVQMFVSLGQQRDYRFGSGEVVNLLSARQAANDDLSDEQLETMVGGVNHADAGLYAFIDDLFPIGLK